MLNYLLIKFGPFRLAVAGFILIVLILFGSVLGFSKIKAHWYKAKAERAKAELSVQKQNVKVLGKDLEQTQRGADNAADATNKQDRAAIKQRQSTAKEVQIIHDRIIKVPVLVLPDSDPVVFQAVRQARDRAQAAANTVSGTQSP